MAFWQLSLNPNQAPHKGHGKLHNPTIEDHLHRHVTGVERVAVCRLSNEWCMIELRGHTPTHTIEFT